MMDRARKRKRKNKAGPNKRYAPQAAVPQFPNDPPPLAHLFIDKGEETSLCTGVILTDLIYADPNAVPHEAESNKAPEPESDYRRPSASRQFQGIIGNGIPGVRSTRAGRYIANK